MSILAASISSKPAAAFGGRDVDEKKIVLAGAGDFNGGQLVGYLLSRGYTDFARADLARRLASMQ